jgi:hypothetical protein
MRKAIAALRHRRAHGPRVGAAIAPGRVRGQEGMVKEAVARAQPSVLRDRINDRPVRREPLENPADLAPREGRQMTGTGVEIPAIIRVVPLAHHERERQG